MFRTRVLYKQYYKYHQHLSFQQKWFSDQGAWPVIGIVSGAVLLCGGFLAHKFSTSPDVRFYTAKRHAVIRDWK